MRGQKHLIKCRCVLTQYKNTPVPQVHQFVVFSVIQDDDTVVSKFAQCNNCGLIHKVVDVCKSEIIINREEMGSLVTIDDIKASLPANLVDVLERNKSDLPTWEQAQFILENKEWGNFVVLAQEEESGSKQVKYLKIMSETFFKVETTSRTEILTPQE